MGIPSVTFDALGKKRAFKFGMGAICRLEEEFDRPFGEILFQVLPKLAPGDHKDPAKVALAATKIRFGHLRSLFAAGLDDGTLTMEEVEAIADEIGHKRMTEIVLAGRDNDLPPGPRRRLKKA